MPEQSVTFSSQLEKVDRKIGHIGMRLMENVNFQIEQISVQETLLPYRENLVFLQKRMAELVALRKQLVNIIRLERQSQGRF